MLQRNAIPPHVGIKGTMNTTFPSDLHDRDPYTKQRCTMDFSLRKYRTSTVNNFSAAGGNTGLLLEDAPKLARTKIDDPRTTFVVSVNAKSKFSLNKNIQNLISYLEIKPDTLLPSLCYTTASRRTQQPHRVSFAVSSISETVEALRTTRAETIEAKASHHFYYF